MSDTLRVIDARIRMAQRGSERIRGVVASTPVSGIVSVTIAGTVLPAICPVSVTVAVGTVVELERPRGVGGQLHIVSALA